jgi:hypothetical protein
MKKIITITLMSLIAIGSTVAAQTWVNGHYRDNGTYVNSYYRTSPDNSLYNNYIYSGKGNPNTGRITDGYSSTYNISPAVVYYYELPSHYDSYYIYPCYNSSTIWYK